MSGTTDDIDAMKLIPGCAKGTHPEYDNDTKSWKCVADLHVLPLALIWQGDCDGFLAVRVSFVPAVNPRSPLGMASAARSPRPMTASNVEIPLNRLPKAVRGMAKLRSKLKGVLGGLMAPKKAGGRKKATKSASSRVKAKPKAKAARRKR